MPHPFIFTDRGLELIGNKGLGKRFSEDPALKLAPHDEKITSSPVS